MAVYLHVEEYQYETPMTFPVLGEELTVQRVAIAGTSAQSAALNASTAWVVLTAQVPSQVAFGTNPTADSAGKYLPADVPRAFQVEKGQSWKVAVITVLAS